MSRTSWVVFGIAALALFCIWRKGMAAPTPQALPSDDMNKKRNMVVGAPTNFDVSKLWAIQGGAGGCGTWTKTTNGGDLFLPCKL